MGDVLNNGMLSFNRRDNVTFASRISGAGGLTQIGPGTLTLVSNSTYTGGTTIAAGTLQLGDGGTTGSIVGDVLNNGMLSFNRRDNVTFASRISGAGGLTQIGPGTLTLTNANPYTGVTTIGSGSTLALTGAASVAQSGGLINNGTFDISGTAGGATITNLNGTGKVQMGSQSLSVVNAGGSFSGTLLGNGALTLRGGGLWILNGDNSDFTGTTDVVGGELEVGDINTPSAKLGSHVQVGPNGTLRGHGTVLGNVANGGTVAPGGSIGTLSVSGNYTQASTSTLAIEMSPTAASLLNVAGSATLNGTLAITYDPGTYTAKRYTIVTAMRGVIGQFSSVTQTLLAGANLNNMSAVIGYEANDVTLTLDTAIASLGTVIVAPRNTSIFTASGSMSVMSAHAATSGLLERAARRTGGGYPSASEFSGVSAGDAAADGSSGSPALWATASGVHIKVGATNAQPGFQANQYGFLAGYENNRGDYTVGVASGYTHSDLSELSTANSGTTDNLRLAMYASRDVGAINIAGTIGYGIDFLSQKRPFEGVGTAQGDHIGQEFTAAAQASVSIGVGRFVLTPRAGLRYAYFHANGFSESGAQGQNLRVGTDNVRSLQPFVGVTLDKSFGDAIRPVNVQLRVGYAREVLDAGRAINVTSQDSTLFVAPGTDLPHGYLNAGVSVGMSLSKRLDISLAYDTLINTNHVSAQAGTFKMNYRF
ncbi:autotransporter [Pandoraea captiosa]|uniref:Autotransporter n=1 Tax=Pandoraea captiosa TaxID=2508302 RepID=A0A5E5AVH7_9BURK|nr:autotransporter [Pandoraea captiosa]